MNLPLLDQALTKEGRTQQEVFDDVTKLRALIEHYYYENNTYPDHSGSVTGAVCDLLSKGALVKEKQTKFRLVLTSTVALWNVIVIAADFVDVIDPDCFDVATEKQIEKMALETFYLKKEVMDMAIDSLRSQRPEYFVTEE